MLYIGKAVQDRMNLLGLTVEELADETFLEENVITEIINNKIALEETDEFDLSLICNVLHCQENFFTDSKVQERDLLTAFMNRGLDNEKSMRVKAKIQDFMNDFAFVTEVLSETR